MNMWPSTASRVRLISFASVLFPAPLAPTMAQTVPPGIFKSISESTFRLLYDTETFLNTIAPFVTVSFEASCESEISFGSLTRL